MNVIKRAFTENKPSEYLHCLNSELNARWMGILRSIPEFNGIGDTIIDLVREKDSYFRAQTILREYDQFPVSFTPGKALRSVAHCLRKQVDAFPVIFRRSVNYQLQLLLNKSKLQKGILHLLIRRAKKGKPGVMTHTILIQMINETGQKIEKLVPLAVTFGVDVQGNLSLFNRNVYIANSLCKGADIIPLDIPDASTLP